MTRTQKKCCCASLHVIFNHYRGETKQVIYMCVQMVSGMYMSISNGCFVFRLQH